MTEPIIFYDIPSSLAINAWSPNTWKIRYCLLYKGLPHKTEWIEYPDIESFCKKIGVPPTGKKHDGRDHYTLPAIYDPNTKKAVVDSIEIAKYLDATYPDTPLLFPPGTAAFQAAFLSLFEPEVLFPTLMVVLARTAEMLNPPSRAYFRKTRETVLGKLEDKNSPESWDKLEKGLGQIKTFIEANGEGKELLFSGEKDKFTYSDFQVAASLVWARIAAGEDSEDWKKIAGFHGGFPGKFLAQFEKFYVVN
ncbi:glutathione transferase GTE1 [Irpex rosettiformis]|uniref:Glutathione transferase GTE1 n=1 Tax=Irpex rosettiformis TaxID=378272 RepID=A0ACB8TUT6_9APHY|nr:glutathione transferase GTE1 [Irpex rosettiformis]